MGRQKKEELTGRAADIAKEYDERITKIRRQKEKALKELAEKQKQERCRMAEKIMLKLKDICGCISQENVDLLVRFMEDNRKSFREYVDNGGDSKEKTYLDIGDSDESL